MLVLMIISIALIIFSWVGSIFMMTGFLTTHMINMNV